MLKEKLLYLCELRNITYDKFLYEIDISEDELFEFEDEDFNVVIFDSFIFRKRYFNYLLVTDRDFLNIYNPKVRDFLEYEIEYCNDEIGESYETYVTHENSEYSPKDFEIDDIIELLEALIRPILPITRHYWENETKYDKRFTIDKMMQESSYKMLKSCEELFKLIANEDIIGDFKIIGKDKNFYIHSWVVNQYKIFSNVFKTEVTLDYNSQVILILIEWMYTGKFYYENLESETLESLLELSDYLLLNSLKEICELLLNDKYPATEYNIKKHLKNFELWSAQFREHSDLQDILPKNEYEYTKELIKENKYKEIIRMGRIIEKRLKQKPNNPEFRYLIFSVFHHDDKIFLNYMLG